MTRRQRRKQRKRKAKIATTQRNEFVLRKGCSPEEWRAAKAIARQKMLQNQYGYMSAATKKYIAKHMLRNMKEITALKLIGESK